MTEDVHSGHQKAEHRSVELDATGQAAGRRGDRRWPWIVLAGATLLIAALVVPPMVSLNRYKSRITRLIAASLGRPVRLSSVDMRVLPWPAFELSDLSVAEDPAYGAEPVLHASTVTASIRFLPLWRGRLEIGTISVDDASLNLVRSAPGKWNLDPLFRTAAVKAGSAENDAQARQSVPLPYLEATNSRINIKEGAEKLPFSLVNTDFELWQESPGEWHIRLRGQPARTDVSLYQEDTGVVRLEANVGRAPALREMPIHLDLDWRQAQLGQLARLVTGADSGWRGDLTGEVHVDGTANAAQVRTRLEASGVHRAEFAPAQPMDFDANCAFVYHYSRRALEDLKCDSPLGDGHVRVSGAMPRASEPQFSFELDHIPVAAGLEALRTLRSDLPEDLEASGTVSGKIAFAPANATVRAPAERDGVKKAQETEPGPPSGSLSGSLTVEDFTLSGGGLNRPVQIPKIVLEPAQETADATRAAKSPEGESAGKTSSEESDQSGEALEGTVTAPAGGTAPLAIDIRLAPKGYAITLRGQANLERARELFRAAGVAGPAGLDAMAGEPLTLDLRAQGAWLPAEELLPVDTAAPATGALADSLSGTVTVRDANWKAQFLAHDVEITEATLHLGNGEYRWDPVEFAYGPVKGSASFSVPVTCAGPTACPPQFEMRFGNLDATTLETAILGVRQQGTLLSDLIERIHPESAPAWPELEGSVSAESLVLGPVTLKQPQAKLRVEDTGAEITHLEAGLLGGKLEGSGEFDRAASEEDKPSYAFDCKLEGASAQAVGRLLSETWQGGTLNAGGEVKVQGYTDADLAGSATGKVHIEWRHGAVTVKNAAGPEPAAMMTAALRHFDLWTADATIGDGAITLTQSQVHGEGQSHVVRGGVEFGDPPKASFSTGNATRLHETARPAAAADGAPTAPEGGNAPQTNQ